MKVQYLSLVSAWGESGVSLEPVEPVLMADGW
jgi:hypothetical protein